VSRFQAAMQHALEQARIAFARNEVPVGAVILQGDQIIAQTHNATRALNDPTAHAEVLALRQAALKLGNYRLTDCVLVCTLEPCVMCIGAAVHARIERIVFGANEDKTGACGSAFDLASDPAHQHQIAIERGVLARESRDLLQHFFQQRR
jgi:tRNA(adenine34) deaminase